MTDSSITRLACPSCGGLLPVPPGQSEFVACPFCSTTLQIRRSAAGVSLALAQQVGYTVGREISVAIGQELARARFEAEAQIRAQQQRQADEARLQQMLADLRRAGTDYARWQQAPRSKERTANLQYIHQQWVYLDYHYRLLYKHLYPHAQVDMPGPPPAR